MAHTLWDRAFDPLFSDLFCQWCLDVLICWPRSDYEVVKIWVVETKTLDPVEV